MKSASTTASQYGTWRFWKLANQTRVGRQPRAGLRHGGSRVGHHPSDAVGSDEAARSERAQVLYSTPEGIAFIPWLPIASGSHATSALLAEVVAEVSATPAQVSLAWLLHRSQVVVPIPGTKSAVHLAENVAAAQLRLSADQLARLAPMGSRHWLSPG